ncbi:MAG TPA: hypothetical protein VFX12_15645 [Vicinamibacterales bacterium]|nr:hypothetical protein [Vicinamibacterales bacterium]
MRISVAIAWAMVAAVVVAAAPAAPAWTPLTSGVSARLRGISAISATVAWASGAHGTILRTIDGGATWERRPIDGTGALDFRDIDALSADVAYALSIGPGPASRIYKTTDGGASWRLQFTNDDSKAFFDAMAFWDARRGVAASDSVDGHFVIVLTRDGGDTWARVPDTALPPALPNEGAFAASGTNVSVRPPNDVWIGTGAASTARVLHSRDGGRTWTIAATPLAAGESAGIFSIAFRDATHGIVVGGDYRQETAALKNAAVTSDGGATWRLVPGLSGFRSVVAYAGGTTALAAGPSGVDRSDDDGGTWRHVSDDGFDTLSIAPGTSTGFASGDGGRIARYARR